MQNPFLVSLQGINVNKLLEDFGSPLYVYDEEILRFQVSSLIKAFKKYFDSGKILFACKSNTNLHIMKIIKSLGIQGIDAVSPNEIKTALLAGFNSQEILYTENYMSQQDLQFALDNKILINVSEINLLEKLASLGNQQCSIRLNLDIGSGHHHHVVTGGNDSKFGIHFGLFENHIKSFKEKIKIVGVHQHIGSKIMAKDKEQYINAARAVFDAVIKLNLSDLQFINLGGGLGVRYIPDDLADITIDLEELFSQVHKIFVQYWPDQSKRPVLMIEPGRYISAECGYLLTRVTEISENPQRTFLGTDTGMNHLMRPALYDSYHHIVNISNKNGKFRKYTLCGNICESGDVLGWDREIAESKPGDIIAICTVGAYGYSMTSNYNLRERPAEVLITQGKSLLIRRRETFEDLLNCNQINE